MTSSILSSEIPNAEYEIFRMLDQSILDRLRSLNIKFIQVQELISALPKNSDNSSFVCAPFLFGKTTALLLYIMRKLSYSKGNNFPRVLMLCPTCEVAENTYKFANYLYCSKQWNFNISLIIKGIKKKNVRSAELIIGTPEKIKEFGYDSLDLTKLETFIIDEADETISSHSSSITYIISKLNLSKCNFILCSESKIKNLEAIVGKEIYRKFETIEFIPKQKNPLNQVFFTYRNLQDKIDALCLVEKQFNGHLIIICEAKDSAEKLIEKLKESDLSAHFLHSKLKRSDKEEVKEQVKKGLAKILIITPSVLCWDVLPKDDVNIIVFNFDMNLLKDPKELDEKYYKKSKHILIAKAKVLDDKSKNLIINMIDKKWENYLSKHIEGNIVNYEGWKNYLDNFFG